MPPIPLVVADEVVVVAPDFVVAPEVDVDVPDVLVEVLPDVVVLLPPEPPAPVASSSPHAAVHATPAIIKATRQCEG